MEDHKKEEEAIGGFDDGGEVLVQLFQRMIIEEGVGEGGVGGCKQEVDHVDEAEDD